MFPALEFLNELNQTRLFYTKTNEYVSINNWELISPKDLSKRNGSYQFDCGKHWISIEISRERIVTYTAYFFEFQETLTELLNKVGYDCFLKLTSDTTLTPINEKTARMLDKIEHFTPLFENYFGSFVPQTKIPHLRSEIYLHFSYEDEKIGFFYSDKEIVFYETKEECEQFYKLLMKYGEVFMDISQDVLTLCRKFDPAAYLEINDRSSIHVCFFSNEMHLGFSYYPENAKSFLSKEKDMLYFTTLYTDVLKRMELTTNEPEKLKEAVLSYMKDVIQKTKIQAAIDGKTHNFVYRPMHELLGYHMEYEQFIQYENCDFQEVNTYLQEHYDTIPLKKIGPDTLSFGLFTFHLEEDTEYEINSILIKKEQVV